MAEWTIEPLSARSSADAGKLVERILRDEFAQALALCSDSDLGDMDGTYGGPDRKGWVALAAGRVVGVIAAKEEPNGALKIKRFYVDAAWRGRGVGRALHDAAHEWIEREGYQYIELTTTEPMARAREFYRDQGYEETGTTDGDTTKLHHFRRTLCLHQPGARVNVDSVPPHGEDEIGVIIERPRGFIEGWSWDASARQLVLDELYPRPVPVNYGLSPEWTNAADGDALDVIVLDDRRMRPGESLVGKAVGVLWRPDGDHKLVVEPRGGKSRPVSLDASYRERVSAWWPADRQPIGWGGPDGVPRLLALCLRRSS